MIKAKKVKREFSAGGIVYRKRSAEIFVLMIFPGGWKKRKPEWTFPKGHLDGKETPEQAALREVREETGLNAKIIQKLGSIKYTFPWDDVTIFKVVTWYLMQYVSGKTSDHDDEVAKAKWFTLAEAKKKLVYKTDKEIFAKVKKMLKNAKLPISNAK